MIVLSGNMLGSCPLAVLRKSSLERLRKRGVSKTVGRTGTSGTSKPETEVERPEPGMGKEPDIELDIEIPEPGPPDELELEELAG